MGETPNRRSNRKATAQHPAGLFPAGVRGVMGQLGARSDPRSRRCRSAWPHDEMQAGREGMENNGDHEFVRRLNYDIFRDGVVAKDDVGQVPYTTRPESEIFSAVTDDFRNIQYIYMPLWNVGNSWKAYERTFGVREDHG
jgi:hypothetical protein